MNIPLNKNSWSLCLLALWIEKNSFMATILYAILVTIHLVRVFNKMCGMEHFYNLKVEVLKKKLAYSIQ